MTNGAKSITVGGITDCAAVCRGGDAMRKEQRQAEILDTLRLAGSLSPKELAEQLYMSLSTVYRDIRDLEGQKLLIRTAEGQITIPGDQRYTPAPYKRNLHREEKIAIARAAAALIPPGAVIHLDSSSTVSYMVDHLAGRRDILALTPSIYVAKLLIAARIPACFCGGKLLENSQVLGGRISQLMLGSTPVDCMFFSPHAISEQGIIFDSVENSSRRIALAHARYRVCLCDRSKFRKTSIFHAASVRDIDYLITDAQLPPDFAAPRIRTIIVEK